MAQPLGTSGCSVYQMGPGTLRVPRGALHGKARAKIIREMRKELPSDKQGVILLMGGKSSSHYDTDGEPLFRQESYFHYLFGVAEPDWYGAIDLKTGSSHLFMPRLPSEFSIWMGPLPYPEQAREKYAVDQVHYVSDIGGVIESLTPCCLHLMAGKNSDSSEAFAPVDFDGLNAFILENQHLYPLLRECRVTKSPEELEIMEFASKIGSAAHVHMMQSCKPGMMEYQLESVFLHHCYMNGGARTAAYTPISASGPNSAILHYGHAGQPNDRLLSDGDLALCDMGCKYYGYDCDITTTFPVNGKFTPNQRIVYEAVLHANKAVKASLKPGVNWLDMHILAEKTILQGLTDGGLLIGNVDEMVDMHIGGVFMPHGLGHFLGLDTHDVGGYPAGCVRPTAPGRKSLRTVRTLQEGMVITIEPGCYFISSLLEKALQADATKHFFVRERLVEFKEFGGVRIEDNVVITANGVVCWTDVPREVVDVEAVLAGGPWPN